ncbi:hypothetical protein ASG43_11970 [Aureimonas sp. Leaf454]|nr:hypothetical protein ASG43_11970 [Aureimonas sp. Leaf454]
MSLLASSSAASILSLDALVDMSAAPHSEDGPRGSRLNPEDPLEQCRRDIEDAFGFARLAAWSFDLSSGRAEMTDAGLAMLGRSRDASCSSLDGAFSLVHPDDRARAVAHLTEAAALNRSLDDTFRMIHGDGTLVHARFRGHPVTDTNGVVVGFRGIWQDITARVTIEERLRETEENHRRALELNAQIPWTAAPDGRILEGCLRWSLLTGLPAESAQEGGWADVIHPDDAEAARAAWARSLATGETFDFDHRLKVADGSFRWMRSRAVAWRSDKGDILRWYGSLDDIDDRKVAERRLRASEAFSRSIVESSGDGIAVLDLDATIRFVNGPAAALDVQGIGDVVGRSWLDLWPPDVRAEAEAALTAARSGLNASLSTHVPTPAGAPAWCNVAVNPIKRPSGEVQGVLVVARDVTDKHMAWLEAEAAAIRLAEVLESTADGILTIDRSGCITYMNGNAVTLLGKRLKVGDTLLKAHPAYAGTPVHDACLAAFDGFPSTMTNLFLPSLGITVDLNIRPTRDGVSIFIRDISEALETKRAITRLAHHDALTGLFNRARYTAFLDEHRSAGALGIILMDLDAFKEVNNTLGHVAGDAVLVAVAERFRAAVGEQGLLARLGGDEFALALPGASLDDCVGLAERLLDSLRGPIRVERHDVRVGVTIGVSHVTTKRLHGTASKRADIALHQAKADGGRRIRVYDADLQRRIGARQDLKLDLASAIERDELFAAYQPMLDIRTGCIGAREALMRWRHPTRGLVSPVEFIPIAEESGLIAEMGEWILRRACREATGWLDGAVVSVNLSPVQFQSGQLPKKVAGALADAGLPPSRLELEITESVLLRDSDDNLAILHALKALGVKIALDDFGTGFSSLSYMRNFPFDKIKIDRAFVGDIGTGNH